MLRIHTGFTSLLASCRIALFLTGCLLASSHALAQEQAPLEPSDPKVLPALTYLDEAGKTHAVMDEKGKLTIVHFWATWCVPCVEELPQVDAVQAAYADRGLKVIALSEDGKNNMSKVKKFLAAHNITHLEPNIDVDTQAFRAVDGKGAPTSFFLDADGKSIGSIEGWTNWKASEISKFIETHLPEKQ